MRKLIKYLEARGALESVVAIGLSLLLLGAVCVVLTITDSWGLAL
jgi:hypothetical protein